MTLIPSTIGTKIAATRSASCWIGAWLRCAWATRWMICESAVSAPVRTTLMMKLPEVLSVPAETVDPALFSTGNGSPESIDSSSELHPSSTSPSAGSFSPGRMRTRSPTRRSATRTERSPPSSTSRAVAGVRSSSSRRAEPARVRPRASSHCPRSTSTMMTVAASK